MKKLIALFVIFVCVGAALSAQMNMSAGGGAFFDMSFNNGVKVKTGDNSYYGGMRNISFGGYGFFDLTYVEANVDFGYGMLTEVSSVKIGDADRKRDTSDGGSMLQLGFSVLGKYPLDMGVITIFPLAGFGYNMALATYYDGKKDDWGDDSAMKWMSQFVIMVGAGADYFITDSLFLRGEALLQLRFPTKMQRDVAKDEKDAKSTLGIGPRIKVAVGYAF